MVVRMDVHTKCQAKQIYVPSETPLTTINSGRVENNLMYHDPLPSLSFCSHLTILFQLIRELLILTFQSQLEAPVSSNHQEPGRLQEAEERGEEGENCRERERGRNTDSQKREGGNTEFSH